MLQLPTLYSKPNPGAAIDREKCKCKLFTPLKIKNTIIKNRIFLSPMGQTSSNIEGHPNINHFLHYGSIAQRGAGLIMIEAAAVKKNGRIHNSDIGLWTDEQIKYYKPIVDIVHFHNGVVGLQLSHSGRKGSLNSPFKKMKNIIATDEEDGWPNEIVGPSTIPYSKISPVPHELSKTEIADIVKAFGKAAKRADEAGIDIIEINSANGFLIHSFLSPHSNNRTDEYGGSFENRIRFCVEVVNEIRTQWPKEKPIFIRFSCSDWIEGGWDIVQTSKLTKIVQSLGVDFVDCSSGGLSPNQKIDNYGPGYQVHFAEEIKRQNPTMLVGAVGIITNGKQAEEIVSKGIDAVSIGRPFLVNTSLVLNWADELKVKIEWPLQFIYGKHLIKIKSKI